MYDMISIAYGRGDVKGVDEKSRKTEKRKWTKCLTNPAEYDIIAR
jgi:hypothetical protein